MTMLKAKAKGALHALRDSRNVMQGLTAYRKTGATPPEAYQSLIRLHCQTQGASNDLLHRIVGARHRPYSLPRTSGALGDLDARAVETIADEVKRQGFYVFPNRLPAELCDRLERFACTAESHPAPARDGLPSTAIYDRAHPLAETYKFDESTLLAQPDIQALAADYSLLAVAQAYLGSAPVLDIAAMWWSSAYSAAASSEAAQLYHFDMDRIKWLKFFVYLTDVGTENGPHCFIAGSHRRKGQPKQLLEHGYTRLTDEQVQAHYPAEAFKEITGLRGTIVAEDTRGFHKGKPPVNGNRLILQLEFCDSLFGGAYVRPPLEVVPDSGLADVAHRFPRVYSKYQLTSGAG